MNKRMKFYLDCVSFFGIVVVMGFGFQYIMLKQQPILLMKITSILIPIGFSKIWWDSKKETDELERVRKICGR